MLSRDVSGHNTEGGVMKPLEGQTAEQIYRAHHNLDDKGKLLPGFSEHPGSLGCQCDHCQEYLTLKAKPAKKSKDE